MIGNVYRGEGFRGLVEYLAGREGSLLLETNLDGASPEVFSRQVGEVRQLYPRERIAHPVCHIPLRPAPGEDLTEEQWNEVLELTLERMGFANSPYVAYLHDHGDGRHLHIAAYRVTFDGKLVSDSNDRFRIMAVAREIEQVYGLTDELPKGKEITPDLDERARRVRLLLDLAEAGPEAAPPLPLPAEYSPAPGTRAATEPAARCQELSAALLAKGEFPAASGAALRAAYHEAMVEALSRSPLRSDREEKARNGAAPLEIEPAQLSVSGTLSLGGGAGSPEIEPAQFPARPGPRVGGGFFRPLPRLDRARGRSGRCVPV